jgi:lipopolysaccharide biosynthesis glycosyltransferase
MNKTKNIIPVFFATDDNYVPFVHVSVESLRQNASYDNIYHIHVLTEGLKEENVQGLMNTFKDERLKIFVHDLTERITQAKKEMHSKYYFSNAIYYRAFIPNMFPEYDRVLYLDCDIAINADVAELFNTDLGDNYIAGAVCEVIRRSPKFGAYAEKFIGISVHDYINSGVMVMDCVKLRNSKFEESFLDILTKLKSDLCPDQDYINIICHGKIKIVQDAWNVECLDSHKLKPEEVKIAHYNIAQKPWKRDNIPYADLFWQYAKDTIFYKDILQMKADMTPEKEEKTVARLEEMLEYAWKMAQAAKTSVISQLKSGKLQIVGMEHKRQSPAEQIKKNFEKLGEEIKAEFANIEGTIDSAIGKVDKPITNN